MRLEAAQPGAGRGQLVPAVFAQVEQLVADMQSQRVQLNREQFLQRIEAITKG